MAHKIKQKIIDQKVITGGQPPNQTIPEENWKQLMSEYIERPECLLGSTYKLKSGNSDHALYITINDIVLNEGTKHEERHPYEIFINSKDVEHFQWVIALTRVLSAVFRKGGDVVFITEELINVFDPKGGYFSKGKFIPSLIAEIGYTVKKHFIKIGLIEQIVDKNMEEFKEKKKEEFKGKEGQLCKKCNSMSLFLMDGCMTCVSCGDSKCG